MCRANHHSPRRNCRHLPAKAPQALAHLCLSDEPGNEVLRALKRFFSPRCERSSEADDRVLWMRPAMTGRTSCSQWSTSWCQEASLMPSETPVQPDRSSNDFTSRNSEAKPECSASTAAAGRLPTILGIQLSGMGRTLPRSVDRSHHAYPSAAVDVGGRNAADPTSHPQILVKRQFNYLRPSHLNNHASRSLGVLVAFLEQGVPCRRIHASFATDILQHR
jgi:hypothetical protein